jgi:hypothetical protein
MEAEGGAPHAPSYSSVTGKEHGSSHFKRPTFELPEGMQKLIWEDEMPKEKPMDIDPETSQPKINAPGNLENASHKLRQLQNTPSTLQESKIRDNT